MRLEYRKLLRPLTKLYLKNKLKMVPLKDTKGVKGSTERLEGVGENGVGEEGVDEIGVI